MENRIVGNVLEKNISFLSRHLILSPTVLQKLRDNDVISESLKRQLTFQDTDEQVPFLVQSLNGQGLMTLKRFLAVLRETGHGWMVDVLLNSQALSYEEIASGQQSGYPGQGQGSDLLRERSRLQGMTPEDARERLTSANLRGRGSGYEMRYGDAGLGGRRMDGLVGRGEVAGVGLPGLEGTQYGNPALRGRGGLDVYRGGVGERFGISGDLPLRRGLESRRNAASAKFRGQVVPAAMFDDVVRQPIGIPASDTYGGNYGGDVTGALLNLHDHFRTQSDTNEQNLSVLKREEQAIKELLEQNVREQSRVRRNQHALGDIGRRLEEINLKANDVYDPVTHSHLSRYRLNQLNQIPWSSDKLA